MTVFFKALQQHHLQVFQARQKFENKSRKLWEFQLYVHFFRISDGLTTREDDIAMF